MITQSISLKKIKDDFVILINNFCLSVTFLVVHFKVIEMYEYTSHIFVYINIIYGLSNSQSCQSTLFLVKVINFNLRFSFFKEKPLMIRNLI